MKQRVLIEATEEGSEVASATSKLPLFSTKSYFFIHHCSTVFYLSKMCKSSSYSIRNTLVV